MGREYRREDDRRHRRPEMDDDTRQAIRNAENQLANQLEAVVLDKLNPFQRKQVYRYFEKTDEYVVKNFRDRDDSENVMLKVYPVGNLRRLAEQKTQEVLMNVRAENLPPMGSFERFVIHDYLKERDGIKTESHGEASGRHIKISPLFGRTPKKAKRRKLTF